ncbi:nuclear protein Qri2/Nse4 [Haloferula helveola]|uniref:Nuclear protein Qri2/Nse4 n=1 Tax=Haloferula helveola TaxID=490095 RepID=A0ABM7RKA9_9BACT|nr:nuclear protein Qri2/Nse4 [Haloferula helveola]
MKKLSENLWLFSFPLKILGVDIRRNVTIIRLASGKLLIHSTAAFTDSDRQQIEELGEPGWLIEGMIDHDTFSAKGHQSFPDLPFYAPLGFAERVDFKVENLLDPPAEWSDEIRVLPLEGAPKMREQVFFHQPSGTLIVCDLLFHFPEIHSLWAKLLLTPTLGRNPAPAFSRRLKASVKDRAAFEESLREIINLPIQRIIPGHGEVLEHEAKARAMSAFRKQGLLKERDSVSALRESVGFE